jgi:ubiquinone/menaquinone biosynthesis C-methylase UbiE/uncharacterized protein YbaR (Trm112 family)
MLAPVSSQLGEPATPCVRPELAEILAAPGTDIPLVLDENGLVCPQTGQRYACEGGVPVFVDHGALTQEKRTLRDFYEGYGWQRPKPGAFFNAQSRYGFQSPSLLEHRRLVNQKQGRFFAEPGKYFLDCASGAIPATEYLDYSRHYAFHVCVDLTLSALAGARAKLKERGLYVNADGTRLPFRSNTFDGILCSHTLYHMPKDEQVNAVREFARVLRPGRKCVIFYNVGEHSLVGRLMFPLVWAKRLRNKYQTHKKMYSHHYPLEWFKQFNREFSKIDAHVYRFFPNQLMKYALPDNKLCNGLGSVLIPHLMRFEGHASAVTLAQYIVVVLEK